MRLRGSVLVGCLIAISLCAVQASAGAAVLYDQRDTMPVVGTTSYENTQFPNSTSQMADDFTVPAGQSWNISEVDVIGNGSGSVPMNAFIYSDGGTHPGAQLFAQAQIAAPGAPSYAIPLSGVPLLAHGTYWVSVQGYGPDATQWFWIRRSRQSGNRAVFRSPGGGFGSGCLDWSYCGNSPSDADQLFALLGTAVPDLSNAFSFGKVKRNEKKGTATLAIDVPGPGTLSLIGDDVKTQRPRAGATPSRAVAAAGTVKLKVKAKASALFKLRHTGKVKVKMRITYTPTGTLTGEPNTQTKRVKLVKKLG
jgi:hypothetical protein